MAKRVLDKPFCDNQKWRRVHLHKKKNKVLCGTQMGWSAATKNKNKVTCLRCLKLMEDNNV